MRGGGGRDHDVVGGGGLAAARASSSPTYNALLYILLTSLFLIALQVRSLVRGTTVVHGNLSVGITERRRAAWLNARTAPLRPGGEEGESRTTTTTTSEKIVIESKIKMHADYAIVENACWNSAMPVEGGKLTLFVPNLENASVEVREMLARQNPLYRGNSMFTRWNTTSPSDSAYAVRMRQVLLQSSRREQLGEDVTSTGDDEEEEEVLLFHDLRNPAHCLVDFIFSQFARYPALRIPFSRYFHSTEPGTPCDVERSWCCFLANRLGIWKDSLGSFYAVETTRGFECAKRVYHPRGSLHRFARDWNKLTRKEISRLHWTSYIETGEGFYPREALREMNRRVLNYDDALRGEREKRDGGVRVVMVYDRMDASRRRWSNADDFVKALERRMRVGGDVRGQTQTGNGVTVRIARYGVNWGRASPLEQARAFYAADVIVSPHGGHLANGIYMAANSTVVELNCNPFVNEEENSGWFTFPARIHSKHLYFPSVPLGEAKCNHYSSVTVDAEALAELVVSLVQT